MKAERSRTGWGWGGGLIKESDLTEGVLIKEFISKIHLFWKHSQSLVIRQARAEFLLNVLFPKWKIFGHFAAVNNFPRCHFNERSFRAVCV